MAEIEEREYFGVVEDFLKEIQSMQVKSVVMLACVDDENTHDVIATWRMGPFELASVAGIVSMHAAREYFKINREEDGDDGETV